jgi:hypothetical protein
VSVATDLQLQILIHERITAAEPHPFRHPRLALRRMPFLALTIKTAAQ